MWLASFYNVIFLALERVLFISNMFPCLDCIEPWYSAQSKGLSLLRILGREKRKENEKRGVY